MTSGAEVLARAYLVSSLPFSVEMLASFKLSKLDRSFQLPVFYSTKP